MTPVPQLPMDARSSLTLPFLFSSAPPEGGQTGGKKKPSKKAANEKAAKAKPVKKQRGGKRK
ncbi:MAG: hypothetical protein DMF60_19290 [Acidobacteria bacterium]|nr:MAG: hypothetical protein DMF60_19290 [Acidobacteriota bacterium]